MAAHDPQPGSYALGETDDERERLVAQATAFDRGWAGYDVLAATITSLLPAIAATRLATAAVADPGGVAASPPLIGAWARVR